MGRRISSTRKSLEGTHWMGYITVIGSLNMDLVVRTPKIPRAGETLAGTDFHLIPGGKGANQSVALARAGAVTRMVGCVGMDAFGPVLLQSLSSAGVDILAVAKLEGAPTGTATILVEEGGENRIIIVAGANGMVSTDYIQTQWPAIQQSDLILLQHEIPLPTIHAIIERAYADGIRVILNPAPIYPIPMSILSKIDTLILNEVEAAALTGLDVFDRTTAREAARSLLNQGVDTAIITLGSRGAVLQNARQELFQPAFKVDVVDTTAAGDTFTGGYAACIINDQQPAEALLYATAASALAVTRLGAQTSIPNGDEVRAFIAGRVRTIDGSPIYNNNGGE